MPDPAPRASNVEDLNRPAADAGSPTSSGCAPRSIDPRTPFFVVMNAGSGDTDKANVREIVERTLRAGGREYRTTLVQNPADITQVAQRVVRDAAAANGVVVVAGGDGTINAVSNALYGSGCPLAVIPQGTFNFFGRTHGLPEDPVAAAALLLTARAHPVQVGLVNGRLFLVNASLGLYPHILEDRETFKRQFGRHRWVGVMAAISTLARDNGTLRLDIEHGGTTRSVRTRTLFVGNNALQLENVGIEEASLLGAGRLVGIVLRPVARIELLWLMARGAFGALGDADQVISFAFGRITVVPHRGRQMKVGTDGEIVRMRAPIVFQVGKEPLHLLKPEPPAAASEPA
jgi:diacylglycerol kinase family enzyme